MKNAHINAHTHSRASGGWNCRGGWECHCRENRQNEAAKFTEQNYLLIPPVSSPPSLHLYWPFHLLLLLLLSSASSSSFWSAASSLSCGNTWECADRFVMGLLMLKLLTESFDDQRCVPHYCHIHYIQNVCMRVSIHVRWTACGGRLYDKGVSVCFHVGAAPSLKTRAFFFFFLLFLMLMRNHESKQQTLLKLDSLKYLKKIIK